MDSAVEHAVPTEICLARSGVQVEVGVLWDAVVVCNDLPVCADIPLFRVLMVATIIWISATNIDDTPLAPDNT